MMMMIYIYIMTGSTREIEKHRERAKERMRERRKYTMTGSTKEIEKHRERGKLWPHFI